MAYPSNRLKEIVGSIDDASINNLSAAIECKQPATVTVPYVPAMSNLVPVNYGINVNPFAASTLGSCGC